MDYCMSVLVNYTWQGITSQPQNWRSRDSLLWQPFDVCLYSSRWPSCSLRDLLCKLEGLHLLLY